MHHGQPGPGRTRGPLVRTAVVGLAAGLLGGGIVLGADHLAGGDGSPADPGSAVVTTTVATAPAESTTPADGAAAVTDWTGVAARAEPGVVAITATQEASPRSPGGVAQGSGFVIDRSGDIVTNEHVVEGASRIQVDFADGTSAPARLVGADASTDIAVVRVDVPGTTLHPLALRSAPAVRIGEPVLAVGNPFGYARSVSAGIVSGLGREITSPNGFTLTDAIQTDAAVNHGNSGGPLLDADGRVIGINAQIADSGVDANVGVAFAVPIDAGTTRVIRELRDSGEVSHAWMGIAGTSVDAAAVSAGGLEADHGVLVQGIAPGSPAADAGLRGGTRTVTGQAARHCVGGDVITAIDGTRIDGMSDLQDVLETVGPGDDLTLAVTRADGSATTLTLTVQAQPARAPEVASGC